MPSSDTNTTTPAHVGSTAELDDYGRRLKNLKRRVKRARNFPHNTCPASRHLQIIAECLALGKPYPMLEEEPEHCAETMLSVIASLWRARTELQRLKSANARVQPPTEAQP